MSPLRYLSICTRYYQCNTVRARKGNARPHQTPHVPSCSLRQFQTRTRMRGRQVPTQAPSRSKPITHGRRTRVGKPSSWGLGDAPSAVEKAEIRRDEARSALGTETTDSAGDSLDHILLLRPPHGVRKGKSSAAASERRLIASSKLHSIASFVDMVSGG